MQRLKIAPALQPEEWKERRRGAVSLHHFDGATHVVVTDPDGRLFHQRHAHALPRVGTTFSSAKHPLRPV